MRRLLEDCDELFDLGFEVDGTPLGELLAGTIDGLEARPLEEWGTEGSRGKRVSVSGRFVEFHYRPHLFPGMDPKLRMGHELQFHLLPRELPEGAPVSIAAVLESYCHLSGDLFGWATLRDGKFLIWIMDMAGHGVRAGLASAVLRVLIDNLRLRSRVGSLAAELNRILCGCVRPEQVGLFATAFILAMDGEGRAVYCSAGHPPMLLRRADGTIESLESLARPIGLFEDSRYPTRRLHLEPGDGLLLYTDGLVETTGRDGEPFGTDRLRRLLSADFDDPAGLTEKIYQQVCRRQDIDRLEDDVTFLAMRF